jgi:hypothetical protein
MLESAIGSFLRDIVRVRLESRAWSVLARACVKHLPLCFGAASMPPTQAAAENSTPQGKRALIVCIL